MTSQHRRYPRSNIWPIEPKAPSLVSLSVRDQNVQRPPKRKSSLKAAAAGFRAGFSSHHLLDPSAHDNLQILKGGKPNSCSSIHIKKTRKNPAAIHLPTPANNNDQSIIDRPQLDNDSSVDISAEVTEPQRNVSIQKLRLFSTTVLRSDNPEESRPSSGLTNHTFDTASQSRKQSARHLISKVVGTMQRKKTSTDQDLRQNVSLVDAWIENTKPTEGSLRSTADIYAHPPSPPPLHHITGSGPIIPVHEQHAKGLWCQTHENSSMEPDAATYFTLQQPHRNSNASWSESATTGTIEQPQLRLPLRIRVSTKTERTEETLTSKEAIWAVVQIHAELPDTPADNMHWLKPIAVAIVLDDSYVFGPQLSVFTKMDRRLATRKDIKKSCLEIMTLATSLEENVDHMGVYSTSGIDIADPCLLSITKPLSITALRAALSEVPQRPRDTFNMQEAFFQAAQALRKLQSWSVHVRPQVVEDIVVISSTALGVAACLEQDLGGLRVHLVNPSLIPYSGKLQKQLTAIRSAQLTNRRGSDAVQRTCEVAMKRSLNGWLLDSARCLAGDCDAHKSHSLTDAMLHAKSQADAGSISDVLITIHKGDDVEIEDVVGDLSYATLLPGQILSIPVRVRLESLAQRISIGSIIEHRSSSGISIADAISELELCLGNYLSELFEVHVTYNHSFFPRNTRLEVRESCWLPRNSPVRMKGRSGGRIPEDELMAHHNSRVQKQIALCMAASQPPEEALHALEAFRRQPMSEGVLSLLEALQRRLKHRLALFEDVLFMDYFLDSEHVENLTETDHRDILENEGTNDLIDMQHHDEDDTPDTPATVVRRHSCNAHQSTEIDEGEARRIWQHIRRTSRPGKPPMALNVGTAGEDEDGGTEKHEPHIEEIRETALRHGRKISSATLRSLAKEFRQRHSSLLELD